MRASKRGTPIKVVTLLLLARVKVKVKGKVHALAIALLTCFFKTRSALQSWKWQLIGMS